MIAFDGLTPLFVPMPQIDWGLVAFFEVVTAIVESLIFYWYAKSGRKVTPGSLVRVCIVANLVSFGLGVFLQFVPWILTVLVPLDPLILVACIIIAVLGAVVISLLPKGES